MMVVCVECVEWRVSVRGGEKGVKNGRVSVVERQGV